MKFCLILSIPLVLSTTMYNSVQWTLMTYLDIFWTKISIYHCDIWWHETVTRWQDYCFTVKTRTSFRMWLSWKIHKWPIVLVVVPLSLNLEAFTKPDQISSVVCKSVTVLCVPCHCLSVFLSHYTRHICHVSSIWKNTYPIDFSYW